jgi:hypothetical protein
MARVVSVLSKAVDTHNVYEQVGCEERSSYWHKGNGERERCDRRVWLRD